MKHLFIAIALTLQTGVALCQQPAGQTQLATPNPADTAHTWAVVNQSVITISRQPSYQAEITTQALLGTPVHLLGKQEGWNHIQTPEGYEGYTSSHLQPLTAAQLHAANNRPKVIVTANNSFIYTAPSAQSNLVTEALMGNILYLLSAKPIAGFYNVALPDNRKGYISAASVKTWQQWQKSISLTGQSIEAVAKRFTGIPYTWGGTSSRGVDCSGLTKSSYLMHGIILPRDARQQYLTGQGIDSVNHFSQLKKGDLLFFGRKYANDTTRYNIVHTAIYLGNQKFIQAASSCVQVNSLNPADADFDAYNYGRYVTARRILGQPANGTYSIFTHPWYN